MTLAVLSALGAMTVFGVAAVLQGVATARVDDVAVLDPRLLLRLAQQPVFLASLALNLLGFGLHVVALQDLPLFLVQAVIAGSVAVTAVLSVQVFGRRLGPREWASVGLVVLGLALLGTTASAGEVAERGPGTTLLLLGALIAVGAGAALARRVTGSTGAVLLGLLAGAGFGVVAVCARLLPDLGPALLTSPVAWLLVLAGATAYLVYSAAMQRGTVTTATAAMVVTQTVVPALAGLLLGDTVRAGLVPLAVVGFALALGGAIGLGRHEVHSPVVVGPSTARG